MHDDDTPMPHKQRHGLDGDIEKTCENCRYFAADGVNGQGDCRRHAPCPSNVRVRRLDEEGAIRFESWWPVMSQDDWCGEFEPIDGKEW